MYIFSGDSHFLSLSVLMRDILLEAWWQTNSDPPRFTSLFYLTDLLFLTSYHIAEQQRETSLGGLWTYQLALVFQALPIQVVYLDNAVSLAFRWQSYPSHCFFPRWCAGWRKAVAWPLWPYFPSQFHGSLAMTPGVLVTGRSADLGGSKVCCSASKLMFHSLNWPEVAALSQPNTSSINQSISISIYLSIHPSSIICHHHLYLSLNLYVCVTWSYLGSHWPCSSPLIFAWTPKLILGSDSWQNFALGHLTPLG